MRSRHLFALLLLCAAPAAAQADFASGYARAVLDHYQDARATATVEGSTVVVHAEGLTLPEKESIARALKRGASVTAVRFPPDDRVYPRDADRNRPGASALPRRPLFEPLLADPRWPGLSGTMVRYRKGGELDRVWIGNFGATADVVGGETARGVRWQSGIQAAVFTQWNMDTLSNDQISDDYLVAFPVSMRWQKLSMMARVYHISTHLGDEFVLTHPDVPRVNLSYEALDVKFSYPITESLRAYGGAGRMIRKDPKDTPVWSTQQGLQYQHPRTFWSGRLRPVAAIDMQQKAMSAWTSGIAVSVGVQLENRYDPTRRLVITAEWYRGKDPNGQFFRRVVEYSGLGVHAYF